MSKKQNNWYARYYRDNSPVITSDVCMRDSFSDYIYDHTKGISIAYIPVDSDGSTYRPVYDAEIAFSQDPSITSRFTSEHRSLVQSSIINQQRSVSTGPRPSDDQLISNGGIRHNLERDEMAAAIRGNASAFRQDIERASVDQRIVGALPGSSPSSSPEPPKSE